MRKLRVMLGAAVVALTLSSALYVASRNDDADAAVGAVTWSDEFDGAAGAAVDGTKWSFDTGGTGWGNSELEYYTNSTDNVRQDGAGHLAITARKANPNDYQCWYGTCTYTSGRILTNGRFTQKYGRFEASIKIPKGQGVWPAFWMLGDNLSSAGWPQSGEIDIMENVGKEPNTVYGTIHGPGYSGGSAVGGHTTASAALGDAFHTYAVDWSPNLIVWYLDGTEYFRATPSSVGGNTWVFDHPFFMILNVAVGGSWPGSPDATTSFPQTMLVDYVRVSAWNESTTTGTALKSNLNGRCIDLPSGNTADGTRIQMWDCNGTAAQAWSFASDGTLRAKGKCMDPAGGALADGTPIQLVTCNGNPVQRFTLSSAGDLVNVSANRCVDIVDNNAANGAKLQLWDCAGTANQKWTKA
ncbi:family 16 glycosylhydrolase [Actinoplanes sp. NPDC051851]|uniref:family 16 glycosylhydrolase n=1 Tax=Actinoplanes sp. NPDC051851 TaxID=3154753 RepID=UPI0034130F40